jgi:hypothetical protein
VARRSGGGGKSSAREHHEFVRRQIRDRTSAVLRPNRGNVGPQRCSANLRRFKQVAQERAHGSRCDRKSNARRDAAEFRKFRPEPLVALLRRWRKRLANQQRGGGYSRATPEDNSRESCSNLSGSRGAEYWPVDGSGHSAAKLCGRVAN